MNNIEEPSNDSSDSNSASLTSRNTVIWIEKNHQDNNCVNKKTVKKSSSSSSISSTSSFQGWYRKRSKKNHEKREVKIIDAVDALYFLFHVSRTKNDGILLRLSQFTAVIMLTFSVILSAKQVVGNPIDCVHTKDIPVEAFNAYCWIHSTYFVTGAMLGVAGVNVAFPGVAPSFFIASKPRNNYNQDYINRRGDGNIKIIKYYQWIAIVLLIQAILFYTPRWLWKGWEGGKIHALMMDLDIGLCSEVEKKQKKKMLLDYLWENLCYHNWWAYRYYLCEVLAFLNVVGQMFLMNRFFDGAFLTFGIDVLRFLESDQEDRIDPMIYVFPRMTKCTFYKYGVSGEVERHDAVCILPLNVVNEKIYVFLWFWFLFLGILSLLTVLYRIVIIFSPRTRVYLLRFRFRLVKREAVETIVRRSKVGDWFLLYMLGENLDTIIYRDVMHELAHKLSTRHHRGVSGMKGDLQEA